MNINLSAYPRPRRCEKCDAAVILGPWGTPLEDRWGRKDRGQKHECK